MRLLSKAFGLKGRRHALCGGLTHLPAALRMRQFRTATVFADVDNRMKIAQDDLPARWHA